MSGGYQSTAYQEIGVTPSVVQEETHPVPEEDKKALLQGVPSPSSNFSDAEWIPDQHLTLKDTFSPKLEKFIGFGLMKWFWWIGLLTIIISALYTLTVSIISAFRLHWGYGLAAIFVSTFMTCIGAGFSILVLRIVVEIILSIFILREKVKK